MQKQKFIEHEIEKELARRKYINFVDFCWCKNKETSPFIHGYHTYKVCERLDFVLKEYRQGRSTFTIIKMPPQHGKQLIYNDLVLTPTGFKKHGEINPGDFVIGRNGQTVKVLSKNKENNATDNLITFSDGTSLTCHDNHEWIVYDRSQRRERIVETWEMKQKLTSGTNKNGKPRVRYYVDHNTFIDFPEQNIPIHPYVLGAWLGDGSIGKNCINMSNDDIVFVENKFLKLNYKISGRYIHKDTGVITTSFKRLYKELKDNNLLRNKHIPKEYIFNSRKNRLELLAGLIDTDGYISKHDHRCVFSNTNKQIIDSVKILVNSLGYRATICKYPARTSSSGIHGRKDVYQIAFIAPIDTPTVIPRRKCTYEIKTQRKRSVVSIEKVKPEKGNCIQVEGGVYLVGETMIPTHNSDLISRYFPPRFLGEFPEKELIIASHNLKLAHKFSRFGRNLLRRNANFQELYDIQLAKDSQSVDTWELSNGIGKAQWFGLKSGIAGSGADCSILDDYLSKRQDADSPTIRETLWNEFTDGFVSRRHDPCIFIILATQWHVDDIIGRYEKKMKEDPAFPDAEVIVFPAKSEKYKTGYLFPEMYSPEFYEAQKAIKGEYGWMSLYQQTPILRGGNMFKINGINIIDLDYDN